MPHSMEGRRFAVYAFLTKRPICFPSCFPPLQPDFFLVLLLLPLINRSPAEDFTTESALSYMPKNEPRFLVIAAILSQMMSHSPAPSLTLH